MAEPVVSWTVDPDDPRAPPSEIWDRLTPSQREDVVENLPSEFPPDEANPPEGDEHWHAIVVDLPDADELIHKLGSLMDQSESRLADLEMALEQEQRLREDEQRLREDERQKRQEVEAALEAALRELEALRRDRR